MRSAALAAAVLAVMLGAGACAKAASAPTKAQYVGMANATCKVAKADTKRMSAEFEKLPAADRDPGDRQRFVRFKLIKRYRDLSAQLRTIPPPDGDGAYIASIYADWDHALDVWYSDSLGTSSDGAIRIAMQRMSSYGLTGCGFSDPVDPAKP